MNLLGRLLAILLFCATSFPQSPPTLAPPAAAAAPIRRVKVEPNEASTLVLQKVALKYPDASRKAGVQGTVVLELVTGVFGDVKEVSVISGDPALAEAATAAVKQWKYKPYVIDGEPVEMQTQVIVNFNIQAKPTPAPLPPGTFRDDTYVNEYLDLFYPLSRDWVRETELMRKKLGLEGSPQTTHVLLAALYVPHNAALSEVNSFFTLIALDPPSANCKEYLEMAAASFQAQKKALQKGDLSQFPVAGRDFYRGNFELREGIRYRSLICTQAKDRLLLWNIAGSSNTAVETSVATLNAITTVPPSPTAGSPAVPPTAAGPDSSPTPPAQPTLPEKVRVSQGVSAGLLVKKVAPFYPTEAQQAHIQGSVTLRAEIDKSGDVVDLELMDGPLELAVSAVNAVRQWKYRPYFLMGKPVVVETQIVVKYALL